jgi:GT2 family glycosyltransferase
MATDRPDLHNQDIQQLTQGLCIPNFDDIAVSIIIPVYNNIRFTLRCIKSLVENTTVPYEIIIVDNGSDDLTASFLNEIQNLQIITNPRNKGYVYACNQGADTSKGEFVLLLNNDTEVTPNWLEALLEPFLDDSVGAVGPKFLYPDNTLQEAGGIIWRDGSGTNYGRGDDPGLPQYCYRREVDYCSGACLLVRKRLWNRLHGFDMRFSPAYYEDTDLCFSIRASGYKVIYQPEANIFHYEGATAGRDINSGMKKMQRENQDKFYQKWAHILQNDHYANNQHEFFAREKGHRKSILIVDHFVPEIDKDSGSLRMYYIVQALVNSGHKIIFWPDNQYFHNRYTPLLQKMGVEAFYGNIDFTGFLSQYGRYIDIVILSRGHIAIHYIHAIQELTKARIIFDTVDLQFLREERRMGIHSSRPRKRIHRAETLKKSELFVAGQSDQIWVTSSVEKKILENMKRLPPIEVIANAHPLASCNTPYQDRKGLVFIGGFRHPPNEDGICWFVESILPSILRKIPDLYLYVLGSHPTSKVKSLESRNVKVTGYIEDVTPYFEASRVFIAPLRYGAGLKGKIGQSLSYGVPVVTTAIGAEGFGFTPDVNALIADGEVDFATKVIEIYNDQVLWEALSANGRELIKRKFSVDAMKGKLAGCINALLDE